MASTESGKSRRIVTPQWILAPLVTTVISVVQLEARLTRAEVQGKKVVFRGALPLKILFGFGATVITIVLYQQWAETELWIAILAIGFIFCFLFGWPNTIVTDERGIECHWWWRTRVQIPWGEVEYAERGETGFIKIVGTNAKITFDEYHNDQERFCKELAKRSKVKKIMKPERFTSLHLK